MTTEILNANNEEAISKAVALLKQGDVVALPTDTIYGIAASITPESGVKKIYDIKARSPSKPIIIYVSTIAELQDLTQGMTESMTNTLSNIWPGAMSGIFMQKGNTVPDCVTAGKKTVAVRIPDHQLCLELVKRVGHPLAVTSANISGMDTHKTAQGVAEQLGPGVPLVLDGGTSQRDAPSTLVDFTGTTPALLRKGALSFVELQRSLPTLRQATEARM